MLLAACGDKDHPAIDASIDAPECITAEQCSGPTDECQHPDCVDGTCVTATTAVNTPTTAQITGDCQLSVCDGAGGTTSIADDTDVPDDAELCTNDGCLAGQPSHAPNVGAMCDGTVAMPKTCNSMGQCGCVENTDCVAPDTCGGGNPGAPGYCGCTRTTCVAQATTCGTVSDGCGTTLNCNDSIKDGTETDIDCGGSTTCGVKCGLSKRCVADTDCASGHCADGVCCNAACGGECQACSVAKKGQGVDGTCGAIKAGSDPDNECTAACNGAAACQ